MSRRVFIVLALVCSFTLSLSGAQSQQAAKPTTIPAPKWHAGEWWRVRTALMTGGMKSDDMRPSPPIRDSKTAFIVYRFTVLGQTTLKYEEQDGTYHIGQPTPPEQCWVVKVSTEPGPYSSGMPLSYRIYFRSEDLSVREVVQEGRRKGQTYFLFSGTSIDNDADTNVTVTFDMPYIHPQDSCPLWAWPHFPISPGQVAKNQSAAAMAGSIKVAFGPKGSTEGAVHQTWFPGTPWWSTSDVGGLRESKLIETSDHSIASSQKL